MHLSFTRLNSDGSEVVGQAWVAITGKLAGKSSTLVVLNSGIHSYSALGSTLHLTLRRSVQYTHYREFQRSEQEGRLYLDQGLFQERLRIHLFDGSLNSDEIEKALADFRFPAQFLMDSARVKPQFT
jgi:hypothetical protein